MVSAINEPGQKPVIPPEIAKVMKEQGIRTLNMLATKCGYGPMTIRRIFLPNHSHKMLFVYMRRAEALDWSLEQFFSICLENTPDDAGVLIAERIRELGMSLRQFSKKIGSQDGGGSLFKYINGDADYQCMRIYKSISTALGITADNLAISLATISGDLCTQVSSGKVLESGATTFLETSKKAYLLRNTRWPRI